MTRLGIVIGSTRPGRRAEVVARWVHAAGQRHAAVVAGDATLELVDLADHDLPLLDEPIPAIRGDYRHAHTRKWAATVGAFDGFVFVTPEYNHSFPAALKNAIDFLYAEWNDKAAGFVSYGGLGGVRAVEHLRTTLAEVKVATVRAQVSLSKYTDVALFTDPGNWSPAPAQEAALHTLLDEVLAWSRALKTLRAPG
ncbi:NAD(P)H-dependent oxidoreductase [Myxococcus sp. CA056]|uniref:NADPH-dependent FMN reductase n=1 Tax=unclassified Myxococcus TaxID=2648731 RepID=UPI00157A46B6|nr:MULTISPECIES: NAD(P)H-dependent oxidoreductase [unclassified Myxococcus]NTX14964.1 NAD(P)H-dependent oxidoreductase [Myxococcus sp. CA056]NTX35971.1 NAD(P)H-dependent oxidoreductase [Myxococcus sp. CA033]